MSSPIILIKSEILREGGAEKYARALLTAFTQKNKQVILLTTGASPLDVPCEVISFPVTQKASVLKLLEFEKNVSAFLKKRSSEIIFGLDRSSFQTHLRAGSGVHRAFLLSRKRLESPWKHLRHRLNPLHLALLHIEKKGFEHPALKTLFTNSHLVKNEILSFYKTDPKKIVVIHNGVEWQEFEAPFEESIKEKREGPFRFLFLGHNFERKGLERLLKGLSLIKEEDFELLVVGKDKNLSKFQRLAHALSLSKQVTFYGGQAEATSFYKKADCLVIPSFYDPFANVTVEALAMGLFVVSSKTNGGSEILGPETGLVIEDLFDDEAVATALKKALHHPKTAIAAKRRRLLVKHLDFSFQLKQYLDLTL